MSASKYKVTKLVEDSFKNSNVDPDEMEALILSIMVIFDLKDDAIENALGILETPVMRSRMGNSLMYTSTILSLKEALRINNRN